MKSIPEALELIYVKKANLRRAFETLQAHSPSLSSFNLTWPDLDFHFASQISSLQRNLDLLQCQQKPLFKLSSSPVPGPARPELKSLCEKMKGLGLRNYITERPSEIITIRDELQDALRCARDPAGLVLVALDGFHDNSECDRRWSWVVLLEALAALKPEIGGGLKEKAKKLAEEWKKKTSVSVENSLACLGFLYLVAAYELADGFDMAVLTEIAFVVVKDLEFKQAVQLCRLLSLNVPDLLSKLEMMSEKLLSVKFILEFKLTDKFPPVPILNEYVQFSKHLTERAKKRRKGTVGMRNAATKEINSLKPVIKIIDEYQLSEYPKEELVKRIESLEKAVEMQHWEETPTSKPQQQANTQDLKNLKPGGEMVNTKRNAHLASQPQQQSNPQEPQQQANIQVRSKSKYLVNQEPGCKMVNLKSVIPPASPPQQQSKPQEPSGSKCLESDQLGDSTVALKRVTDESKQSASVPIPKPQQQSKPEEPSGSKHQKQSNPQEPPSGNGSFKSEQPGDTKVGSNRVTDESQQSATVSASLSSFNVTWQDLESHFVSQTSSLQSNLELLQCQQKSPFIISSSPVPGPARPDLKSLCEKMKGLGLRNYIMERPSEIITIRDELQDALRCSRDPAGMVLVALEGFHDASPMGNENSECDRRWSYVVLLEALAALKPEIGGGLKEKVKKLAEEWQKKTSVGVENSLDCLGFLYLVAAYGLADSFDMDVLIDIACVVVKDLEFEQAVQLCRFLSLNIQDLISKLETVNEKLRAVIILEFKLTDKLPPVPILNEHQLSKKRSRSQLIEMQTNAATEEVNSLKPAIEIESLEKAVEMRNSAETLKPQQQSNTQDPSESKQLKNHEPCDKMVNTERVIHPLAASQPQKQSKPQEPSGSKSLGSGQHQPGDTTVGSKPEEAPSGSKRQKQSNPQEPPSGNGSVKSDQPGDTTVGSKPPSAEQVGHKVIPKGTVLSTSNFSAIPQSNLQPAAPAPIGTVAHFQQPGQWPVAHPGSFAGSPAGPYSWRGPYPNLNPNNGYGLPPHHQLGQAFGIPGNLRPPGPRVYPPELHHPPAGYFPVPPHNGHGLPPNYHQR